MKVQIDYDANGDISKQEVQVDKQDCWDAAYTLSLIILPILKRIREDKQGAPYVDDEDVPEEIRSIAAKPKENEWDIDEFHFKRFEYVLDEMIWAFEDHAEGCPGEESCFEYTDEPSDEGSLSNTLGLPKVKVDWTRLDDYRVRKQKAFNLFGKMYMNLWT